MAADVSITATKTVTNDEPVIIGNHLLIKSAYANTHMQTQHGPTAVHAQRDTARNAGHAMQ